MLLRISYSVSDMIRLNTD